MTTKVTIKIFVNNNYLLDINTNVIIYFRKRIVKKNQPSVHIVFYGLLTNDIGTI